MINQEQINIYIFLSSSVQWCLGVFIPGPADVVLVEREGLARALGGSRGRLALEERFLPRYNLKLEVFIKREKER